MDSIRFRGRGAALMTRAAVRRGTGPLFAAVLIAGCASAATPPPTASGPVQTAAPSHIAHPTGSTDLVLRMEMGGGFVPIGFIVSQAPTFSLYGDGTVIYRSPQGPEASPLASPFAEVIRSSAFRTGKLADQEVQDVLAFALDTGGLRDAAANYDPGNIADASSTIFTINAGGIKKTVTIVALEMGSWPASNAAIPRFVRLADRLDALDVWGKLPGTYSPIRYRTVLSDFGVGEPAVVRDWPWAAHKPADWTLPTDQARPPFPTLVMTPADLALTGVPNPDGGFQNLMLRGPDGKVYAFAIRPLLPDETA